VPTSGSTATDLADEFSGRDHPLGEKSTRCGFDRPGSLAIVAELALTGKTWPIKGVLAMALHAAEHWE
jgi:magnesium chelatase family protein